MYRPQYADWILFYYSPLKIWSLEWAFKPKYNFGLWSEIHLNLTFHTSAPTKIKKLIAKILAFWFSRSFFSVKNQLNLYKNYFLLKTLEYVDKQSLSMIFLMTDLKVFYFLKLCLIFVGSVDRFAKVDKQKIQIHFFIIAQRWDLPVYSKSW